MLRQIEKRHFYEKTETVIAALSYNEKFQGKDLPVLDTEHVRQILETTNKTIF